MENKPIKITKKELPEINITKKESPKIVITEKFPRNMGSRDLFITKREQIKDIVEAPLVEACEVFWDKNIKSRESSANFEDIKSGYCWITIDWDSLSDENKIIGKQSGELLNDPVDGNILNIKIPVEKTVTQEEISKKALNIATAFQKQKAVWISGTSLEDQIKAYRGMIKGGVTKDEIEKEIERISQPGVWEKECKERKGYFDEETERYYQSEELCKKAKE